MIEYVLQNLDALLLVLCGVGALAAAVLMLVLRHPMHVAISLISTMTLLGAIYGLVGVHFIAAFQVLIYVSAVMVFMVYVIMLLDVRDPSFTRRFSTLLVPGAIGGVLLLAVLAYAFWRGFYAPVSTAASFADVSAAGGGSGGGAGRHQGHPEKPWIRCSSSC
jgi:NADH:ubiquinone oxidoreductase subunit 6 (subunit J)